MAKAQAAAISEKNGILASLTSCFIWGILPCWPRFLGISGCSEEQRAFSLSELV